VIFEGDAALTNLAVQPTKFFPSSESRMSTERLIRY